MATKTAVQRITATLTFLQNTNLPVTAPARAAAHLLAQAYVNNRFPMGAASPGYTAFSEELSLGYHFFDDPNERRHMARALFLLWKAIHARHNYFVIPKANIGQISQAGADRQLVNYIRKAYCVQDRTGAGNAGTTQALADFRANPLDFMRDNRVYVRGSTAFNLATPTNVQPCQFYYDVDRDRFVFFVSGAAMTHAVGIQVESVKAFHWTDARYVPAPGMGAVHDITTANFGNMLGIQLSGAHLMATTQFTGCSFCMADSGAGNVYCAHVSPFVIGANQNTDGRTLARRIMATGAVQNAGGVAPVVYGRNAGTAPHAAGYTIGGGGGASTYMTIVGFPVGASYNIFAQTTENDRIQGVPVQIFP